jgi:hypothetical protein
MMLMMRKVMRKVGRGESDHHIIIISSSSRHHHDAKKIWVITELQEVIQTLNK